MVRVRALFFLKGTMRKVKVLGHELDIMFNMAVQIEFEEISGKPFDIKTLDTQTATMQLCYASLKVSNHKVPFTFEDMVNIIDVEETASLKDAVFDEFREWYKIPKVSAEDDTQQDKEGN